MRTPGEQTSVGTIVEEKRVFEHPFFSVISRVIRTPDGVIRDEQLLWDRGGKEFAVVIATDEEGRFVLVSEPKYGQMCRFISAPTGAIKENETAMEAGKRELLAETGYESGQWRYADVARIVDFADKSDGGAHVILYARGVRKVAEPRDPDQLVVLADKHTLLTQIIPSGVIPAMSIAALLLRQ